MAGTTVRIREETREKLRELVEQTGQQLQDIIANAVDAYQRHQLLHGTNRAYAALRNDEEAWRELQAEREEWDVALADTSAGEPPGDGEQG